MKPLHAGHAARHGVVASLLAADNFSANPDVLEGPGGFAGIFSSRAVEHFNAINLGHPWRLADPGVSLKAYPCCRATHPSISAALQLKDRGISADSVVRIDCATTALHRRLARFDRPHDGYEARFSIPYCIATALLRGAPSFDAFTDEALNDPDVQELLAKVHFQLREPAPSVHLRLAQRVTVVLNDGRECSAEAIAPRGDPANPMSDAELEAKWTSCLRRALPADQATRWLDLATKIDSLPVLDELMGLSIAEASGFSSSVSNRGARL